MNSDRYVHDCKHFNGIGSTTCRAGVAYQSVRAADGAALPGCGVAFPCIVYRRKSDAAYDPSVHFDARLRLCPKLELYTAAETEANNAAVIASMERFAKVLPIIRTVRAEHKGTAWAGVLTCPVCQTRLMIRHSTNGHTSGKCETSGCVGWIE